MNKFLVLCLLISLMSCGTEKTPKEFKRLEVWEGIQVAVKEKNIDYLLEISQDTLDCLECNDASRVSKEDFFSKHFDQIKPPFDRRYSFYEEKYDSVKGFNKRYRIMYDDGKDGDESSMIVYTILTGENGIKYLGAFWVP